MRPVDVRLAVLTLALACAGPAPRVSLVAVGDGTCGRPAGATELRITALSPGGELVRAVALDGLVEITDFPADTEQLAVEVLVGGGRVAAAGKSSPLAYGALADGATIPVFMAPVDGFCATGPLREPRIAPLVATAGDSVLVVGGVGVDGTPLRTAERYELATGTFVPVEVPAVLGERGFVGAALTELPDGRVIVSGGPSPSITIYDPATHAFGPSVLVESRAFHAAVVVDDTHVLLAGGCSAVESGQCAGVVRKSSKRYPVDDPSAFESGPTLVVGRIGATALDLGVGPDGSREVLIAGGTAPDARADRIRLDGDTDAVVVEGLHAQVAALDGGVTLSVDPASGATAIAPASGARAIAAAPAPSQGPASLVTLEDGHVLAFGDAVGRYDPTGDRWDVLGDRPDPGSAPTLHRLDDGSVLVFGGSTTVTRFRPSLVGPSAGALTVLPGGDGRRHVLTPSDPSAVLRSPWTLANEASALVGGPRMAAGRVRLVGRVRAGGVALIAGQRGPGQAIVAELVPGEPVRLVRLAGSMRILLCSGESVTEFAGDTATTLELAIDRAARVSRDGALLLACAPGDRLRGAWGVGTLGQGGALVVDAVSVARK